MLEFHNAINRTRELYESHSNNGHEEPWDQVKDIYQLSAGLLFDTRQSLPEQQTSQSRYQSLYGQRQYKKGV